MAEAWDVDLVRDVVVDGDLVRGVGGGRNRRGIGSAPAAELGRGHRLVRWRGRARHVQCFVHRLDRPASSGRPRTTPVCTATTVDARRCLGSDEAAARAQRSQLGIGRRRDELTLGVPSGTTSCGRWARRCASGRGVRSVTDLTLRCDRVPVVAMEGRVARQQIASISSPRWPPTPRQARRPRSARRAPSHLLSQRSMGGAIA